MQNPAPDPEGSPDGDSPPGLAGSMAVIPAEPAHLGSKQETSHRGKKRRCDDEQQQNTEESQNPNSKRFLLARNTVWYPFYFENRGDGDPRAVIDSAHGYASVGYLLFRNHAIDPAQLVRILTSCDPPMLERWAKGCPACPVLRFLMDQAQALCIRYREHKDENKRIDLTRITCKERVPYIFELWPKSTAAKLRLCRKMYKPIAKYIDFASIYTPPESCTEEERQICYEWRKHIKRVFCRTINNSIRWQVRVRLHGEDFEGNQSTIKREDYRFYFWWKHFVVDGGAESQPPEIGDLPVLHIPQANKRPRIHEEQDEDPNVAMGANTDCP